MRKYLSNQQKHAQKIFLALFQCSGRRKRKLKQQKYLTPRKFINSESVIKGQNIKVKYIKQMDNNCHIPVFVQAFSYVENGG